MAGYFNWSLSYRLDSDFPVPYGRLEQVATHPTGSDLAAAIEQFGARHAASYAVKATVRWKHPV